MSSSRNKGNGLLDKKMISARIPVYVIHYCKEKSISFSQLCMKGFDFYRSTDKKHAIERLKYHKERVLHWEGIVLQNTQECNTKHVICNTVKQLFFEQNRGNPKDRHMDMNWLEPRAKDMVAQGIPITAEELYNFCIEDSKLYKEGKK